MDKVAIWGCGLGLRQYYQLISRKWDIVVIFDNDSSKMGSLFEGILVDSPKNAHDYEFDRIVISVMDKRYNHFKWMLH